jgi:CHAT domain
VRDEDNQVCADDDDGWVPEDALELDDAAREAAEEADAIMEGLARYLDADSPDILDAFRSAAAELAKLENRLATAPWLLPELAYYQGLIHQELWGRLGDPADLNAACKLLLQAIDGASQPDEEMVSALLSAIGDRLEKTPSSGDRDTFITWASWQITQPPAEPEQPDHPGNDDNLLALREQAALLLHDRADSGEGDRRADLDSAIEHFEVLIAATSAEAPDRGELLGLLVLTCWDRIDGDASQYEQVDRLIRHAREAREAPGLPDDVRILVALYLGIGLSEQMIRPGWQIDLGTLDLAIDSLLAALPTLPTLTDDPGLILLVESRLGVNLVGRGQLSRDSADLAAAEPHLTRAASLLPEDHPLLADITYDLALAECGLAVLGMDMAHSDLAVRLLRTAAKDPPADPERAATIHWGLACVLLVQTAGQRGPEADEGIEHLTIAFQTAPADSAFRLGVAWNLASALTSRFFMSGDRQHLQAAQFYLDAFEKTTSSNLSSELANLFADLDLMRAVLRTQIALARGLDGDLAALDQAVEDARTAVRLAGPRHPQADRLRSDLGVVLLMRFAYGRRGPADLQEGSDELEAVTGQLPVGHAMRDMLLFRAAWAVFAVGLAGRNPQAMRAGIARMGQVRANAGRGAGDPLRVTAALAAMGAELYGMTRAAADLGAARDWFATASAEFEQQPGHPQHATLLSLLARLERRAGAAQASVQTGLAALRVRARDVLLQTGPAHGLASARIAAAEAAEIAGWCLEDKAAALAVEALELGRGLVLHAATSAADMPELLAAAGHDDLAGEWRCLAGRPMTDELWDRAVAPDDVTSLLGSESLTIPSGLRGRTLNAMGATALVAPPDHREIAAALARSGADALVYLLPPVGDAPGRALVVPADGGDPHEVPLPLLHPKTSGALADYEAAQARLLAAPRQDAAVDGQPATDESQRKLADDRAKARWEQKLELLSEWAWTAVMSTLLAEFSRGTAGGAPRLVLVPTGRLGIVPWHAARRPARATGSGATGWRYAAEDAVFSYAVSGRQFAEVTRRPALPLADDPVIVAPLGEDLAYGLMEASALRERYPNARYLGFALDGRVDSLALPNDVLGVLPAAAHAGASLLHLVCHGVVTSAGADASFLLLDEDRRLTVKAILRQAHGRPSGASGGLVDLSSCRTDLTAADYDEALTLSTAFLASGAVTAVGSRWEIPDGPSAMLMFMFHHFLDMEGYPPRDALRSAQLWMLDPGRVPPAAMPAGLRKHASSAGLADITAWAALTHQGQ